MDNIFYNLFCRERKRKYISYIFNLYIFIYISPLAQSCHFSIFAYVSLFVFADRTPCSQSVCWGRANHRLEAFVKHHYERAMMWDWMFHKEECVPTQSLTDSERWPLYQEGRPLIVGGCSPVPTAEGGCRRRCSLFSALLIISLSFYPAARVAPENETTCLVVYENEERKR